MKINVLLKYTGYNRQWFYNAYDVFLKYKTYHPSAYDQKALKYYYFVLNNVIYLKII